MRRKMRLPRRSCRPYRSAKLELLPAIGATFQRAVSTLSDNASQAILDSEKTSDVYRCAIRWLQVLSKRRSLCFVDDQEIHFFKA